MLIASGITSLPIICNKIARIKKQNTIIGSIFLSTRTIMFLSCSLGHLLDSDSYTPLIKILINILEHSFSEFIFN